jgi:hypothetical protein
MICRQNLAYAKMLRTSCQVVIRFDGLKWCSFENSPGSFISDIMFAVTRDTLALHRSFAFHGWT